MNRRRPRLRRPAEAPRRPRIRDGRSRPDRSIVRHRFPALPRLLRPTVTLALLYLVLAEGRVRAAQEPFAAIGRHLRQPVFDRATWGVLVADAATGTPCFEAQARRRLKPGSGAKLFTAALALDRFGPDHVLVTDLLPAGRFDHRGILRGDLVLFGRGDFSFAARFHQGRSTRPFDRLVDALRDAGLRGIVGDLVADDSHLTGSPYGGSWTYEDLRYYYGAGGGGLNADDNVLDLVFRPGPRPGAPVALEIEPATRYLDFDLGALATVDAGGPRAITLEREPSSRTVRCSGTLPVDGDPWTDAITVPEPARFFAFRLREELEARGIAVRGGIRVERGAADAARRRSNVASALGVPSPPMSELVARMMKPSQNLYAQLLLRQVGAAEAAPGSAESSEAEGLRALGRFLERAGIPGDEVLFDDGAGLSRSALVTPAAMVRLLLFMDRHPHREAFLNALPVAGRDGTLRRRLAGTAAEGNLHGKTGTLRYVHSLSGFVTNAAGHRLIFAALLNAYQPPAGGPSGRDAIDTVGRLLAESTDAPNP